MVRGEEGKEEGRRGEERGEVMLSHALALVMDDGAPLCMTLLSSLPFFFSSSCRLPAQCSMLIAPTIPCCLLSAFYY